jgi:hypothetical protein
MRRLVHAMDKQEDVWVLVADSAGINVWCAAGGGYFTADKVIAAIKSSHLEDLVDHHALILPQLCANAVDGWQIRKKTGWGVHWGPVRAVDIPAYLAGKPVVGVGMQPEQIANLACLVRKGFAIRVPKSRNPSKKVQEAIQLFLQDNVAKQKALEFSKIIQKWDGPHLAADLIYEKYGVAISDR